MRINTKTQLLSLLFRAAALSFLLIYMISCGRRDDRSDIRAQRGEPDEIQTIGSDPFWRELWYYNQTGVGYEFRRTAACGAPQDVYLYLAFNFIPPGDSTTAALSRPQKALRHDDTSQSPLSPF